MLSFFDHFWALFPLARTPTQNSGAMGQILRYTSEIFFGAYCDSGTRCPSWHKLKTHFRYIGTPYRTLAFQCKIKKLKKTTQLQN